MAEQHKDKYYYQAVAKAIEQATNGMVFVHFQVQGERYIAMVLPLSTPFYLPIDRNRPNALHWVEANHHDDVYQQLMQVTGVVHQDEWYFNRDD